VYDNASRLQWFIRDCKKDGVNRLNTLRQGPVEAIVPPHLSVRSGRHPDGVVASFVASVPHGWGTRRKFATHSSYATVNFSRLRGLASRLASTPTPHRSQRRRFTTTSISTLSVSTLPIRAKTVSSRSSFRLGNKRSRTNTCRPVGASPDVLLIFARSRLPSLAGTTEVHGERSRKLQSVRCKTCFSGCRFTL
jgi:hypothetical protein